MDMLCSRPSGTMYCAGILVLILCSTFHFSNGQLTNPGPCPDIPAKANFDFPQYEGVWYEVGKYMFLPQIVGTCVYVRYKDFVAANATFVADIVHVARGTRKHVVTQCTGKIASDDRSAEIDLIVNVPMPLTALTVGVFYPYKVLDTDYKTYSIKWACTNVTPAGPNIQTLWILSRSRTYPPEVRELVRQKLSSFGLNPDIVVSSEQTNCPAPRD